MKFPEDMDYCMKVDTTTSCITEVVQANYLVEPLESCVVEL